MIRKLYRTAAIIFALCLILCAQGPLSVFADGEDPRLEISVERIAPGMLLQVRGVNLAREENISISLVGVAGEFPLGVIASNEVGEFSQSFVLPSDLPQGTYRVLARLPGAAGVVSAPLKVQGPAVMSDQAVEASGQREQEEQLLASIPTRPGLSAASATTLSSPASSRADLPSASGTLVLILLAVILLVVMIEWRRRRQLPSR